MSYIRMRCEDVRDLKDGTFSLKIEERPLTPEESATIRQLFPILGNKVYDLLLKEAVLAAIFTEEEMDRMPPPPPPEEKKKSRKPTSEEKLHWSPEEVLKREG